MDAAPSIPSVRRAARGAWPLEAGRVLKLRPRETALLRAGHGRLWVTFERPQGSPALASDDHFLEPGDRLRVEAGQTVVLSAIGARGALASFDWELDHAPARRAAVLGGWRQALVQAWAGFGLSLAASR